MLEVILKRTRSYDVLLILIASVAIVGFWRGIWNLMDHFVFTGNFILSQLITIFVGVAILLLMAKFVN